MKKAFLVAAMIALIIAAVVFLGLSSSRSFAQTVQRDYAGNSNIEKALEQLKTEANYGEWKSKYKLLVYVGAFAATKGMTETILMRRVNANPALLQVLQETSRFGILTVFTTEFDVSGGIIEVDFRATDEEIITFLKK